ncbi:MAG: TIGR03435 family protein [Acidobacteriia bacterium]|nr:TIGR03435 family protein [Terriglobia bacterium]
MKTILFGAIFAGSLLAQAPSNLKFEVASVRPAQPMGTDRVDVGVHVDGAQVRMVSLPMRDYIARAYRMKLYQVTGPEWLTSERFDVIAKLPQGSTPEQIPEMLQSLLEERFQIKVHREKKELPIYALMIGKPPLKIQESAPDPNAPIAPKGTANVSASGSAAGVSVDLGNGSYYTFNNGKFEVKKVTMDMLARQLERYVDRPIVDITDLKGTYDLTFSVTTEDYQAMLIHAAVNAGMMLPPQVLRLLDNGSIASLMDGLQQLGLKIDARKAPLDVLVIDQLSKTPTDN